jgi:hypothetical protein
MDCQSHVQVSLLMSKTRGTHYTAGWVGSRAGLDVCVEKRKFLAFTGVQIPNHSSFCESLYEIRYPSHAVSLDLFNFPLFYKDVCFLLMSFYLLFFLVDKEFVRLIPKKYTLQTVLV